MRSGGDDRINLAIFHLYFQFGFIKWLIQRIRMKFKVQGMMKKKHVYSVQSWNIILCGIVLY